MYAQRAEGTYAAGAFRSAGTPCSSSRSARSCRARSGVSGRRRRCWLVDMISAPPTFDGSGTCLQIAMQDILRVKALHPPADLVQHPQHVEAAHARQTAEVLRQRRTR
jgi:hypothetical protein